MPQPSSTRSNREVLERFNEMVNNRELDHFDEVLTPDFVQEMPQSCERVVGIENFRKTIEMMPGASETALQFRQGTFIEAGRPHYLMTPTFNVVKVEDAADQIASYLKAKYPDGSEWYIVSFATFRDGKIAKWVGFFAPFYESPQWRTEWVEIME